MSFFELITPEGKLVADFFKNAYGWTFTESVFQGGQYLYTSDPDKVTNSFMLGIRQPKMGEKCDLVAFVTVKNLTSFSENLTRTGARTLGSVEDYEPHGFLQRLTIPGGIVLGLWQPPLHQNLDASKAAQASAQRVDQGKPEVQSMQDIPSH